MKKYKFSALLIVIAMTALLCSACCLSHDWAAADCENPETCTKCGKTQGEALGHDWAAADCVTAETCTRCGKTQGSALGHDQGEWQLESNDLVNTVSAFYADCTRCGERLETKEEPMEDLIDEENGVFLFTPAEFFERFTVIRGDHSFVDRYEWADNDGEHITLDGFDDTDSGTHLVTSIGFYNKEGVALNDKDSHEVASVGCLVWLDEFAQSKWDLVNIVVSRIEANDISLTLDPTLDGSAFISIYDKAEKEETRNNGLNYASGMLTSGSVHAHAFRVAVPQD